MPPSDVEDFFSGLAPVKLTLGQVIYQAGGPLDHVYFMEQGIASVLTRMSNGETIEAGMIGPEGMVGLPTLLGNTASKQYVVVQAPGTALPMAVPQLRAAFNRSAAIRDVMLHYAGKLLDVATQTAACNQLHTLTERCARWLLMMHDRLQADDMPLTHEFLSSMLGVRRSRVTEAVVPFRHADIITYSRGRVTVRNLAGLEAAACECYRNHDRLREF